MTLSCILLAAPKRLHLWHEVGGSMIAIDTLVDVVDSFSSKGKNIGKAGGGNFR
jgi:hypothetical protein